MSAAFSFGAGALDGKALDGFRGPGQHATDSWSAALVRQTDPEILHTMIKLCPGSRRMVLKECPRLAFVLNLGLNAAGRERERASTARLISRRSPRSSGLHLIREGAYGLQPFSYGFADTKYIAYVVLRDSITSEDPAVLCVLLDLKDTHEVQLKSTLTEQWCGLLRRVPHIRELRVKGIEIQSYQYQAFISGCPWTKLHIAQDTCAQRLAWAPQPVGVRLGVELADTALLVFYVFPTGLSKFVHQRLATCDITLGRGVLLRPHKPSFRDDDTYYDALALALQQLTLLNVQGRKELHLYQFTMTPQTASLLQQEYNEWSLALDRCQVVDITGMIGSGLLGSLTGLCDPAMSLDTDLVMALATGTNEFKEMTIRDTRLDKGSASWGVQGLEKVYVLNPSVDTQQWAYLPQALTHPYVVETHGQQSVQMLVLPTIRSPQDAHTVLLRPVGRPMASAPAAIRLCASPSLKPMHHAAALETLLTRIQYHEWAYKTLVLVGWHVKPAVLGVLRAATEQRPGLGVYMYEAELHASSCLATEGPLLFIHGLEIVGRKEPGRSMPHVDMVANIPAHGGYTTGVPPDSISWWLRVSELNGLFARLSEDVTVSVWDCGLVFDLRHADEMWPRAAPNLYNHQTHAKRSVVPHKVEFKFSRPALTTFILQPPAPNLPLHEQAACMRLNVLQLRHYPTPDSLVIDGFTVAGETTRGKDGVAVGLQGAKIGRAMHLGPNLVYPPGTDEAVTRMCQEFGAALPDPRRVEWVANGTRTTPQQLADMLLGRDASMGSKVHVITTEKGYVTAVRAELAGRPVNIQACTAAPTFLCKVPGIPLVTLEQCGDAYAQAMRAAGAVASALRRAAEAPGTPMDLDTTTMYKDATSADVLHGQARDLAGAYYEFRKLSPDAWEPRLCWLRMCPTPEELFRAAAGMGKVAACGSHGALSTHILPL